MTGTRMIDTTARRIDMLENKVARLEHHFVTLDKQLGKQARRIEELEAFEKSDRSVLELMKPVVMDMARRIEELEAAQARQGDGK